MKAGWQIRTLGEVCKFQRGLTYAKGDEVDTSKNIVLRANNIDVSSNLMNFNDLKFISDTVSVPDSKKVRKDSILICTASGSKSHLGKVAFIDDDYDYAFGGFMGMITLSSGLYPKYLFHLMTSLLYKDFISALADGVNINNLKFDDLMSFKVSFPSLAEQQRIVTILDEAFEGIATATANAKKNLTNALELFESELQSVFANKCVGWEEKKLEELCDIKHGFAFDGQDFTNSTDSSKPIVITPGNFTEYGTLNFTDRNTKRFFSTVPKEFVFNRGDLVVVMTDLSSNMKILGRPAMIERDGVLHNQRIGRILIKAESIDIRLIYYFLMTKRYLNNVKLSATGTMVKHTAPKRILSNKVTFPPDLSEQRTIVTKLDQLSTETKKLEAIYQQKLVALEELKKSILNQAFSGQLN